MALIALLVVGLIVNHPENLECGTDATTRLKLGARIMQGQVVPGTLEDNITLIVDADWKGAEVRAPVGVNFAVRLIGGGSITPNVTKGSLLNITFKGGSSFLATTGGVFRLILEGASAATNSELRVGFSADGPPGVKLLTSKTPPGPAPPTPLLPFSIVDTHVHLSTTTNGINYTWARDPSKLSPPQQCPCRPPCFCNMSLPEYIGAIVAQPPPGFGTQPVATYAKHLDELQSLPLVRGVRVYLNTGTVETLKGGLEELGLRNMVVDFFVPDVTNSSVVDIVRESAGTTFNIEHLGCGCDVKALHDDKELFKRWRLAVWELARLPNIGCFQVGGTMAAFKTKSAVDPKLIQPFIQTAVEAFGYDRLCFEANWFFCNFVDSMDGFSTWVDVLVPMLKEIGASEADLEMLFRTNAMRVYGIV
eukprot:gene3918-32935_t